MNQKSEEKSDTHISCGGAGAIGRGSFLASARRVRSARVCDSSSPPAYRPLEGGGLAPQEYGCLIFSGSRTSTLRGLGGGSSRETPPAWGGGLGPGRFSRPRLASWKAAWWREKPARPNILARLQIWGISCRDAREPVAFTAISRQDIQASFSMKPKRGSMRGFQPPLAVSEQP